MNTEKTIKGRERRNQYRSDQFWKSGQPWARTLSTGRFRNTTEGKDRHSRQTPRHQNRPGSNQKHGAQYVRTRKSFKHDLVQQFNSNRDVVNSQSKTKTHVLLSRGTGTSQTFTNWQLLLLLLRNNNYPTLSRSLLSATQHAEGRNYNNEQDRFGLCSLLQLRIWWGRQTK